ncbi:MAG: hypothetical protein A3H59_02740 [Candidatus Jacksonbacteria bacterium RIFCSPLOWO2_02_FULL_43_9]|nr:MAG: hypothetical protein UV70_C0011G0037 [Parcubacteria group bacterium GW2011_GWA2_43_13]OGY69314.1 MAG: hypothetical protein A3B94_03000 [Candidatus Jacksonbacteria bacterium RIFCSPHIGHO2_02_FULL_43_10]OGY71483.1 MAG: hypothetical protein A2986_04060 [Candidatus Jacksonbacteria bacterium RIFCSPLOWO2_01_FULL_44_13]OGY71926.1 MAG: hypothetical protein A3H59_02740 [Candidatus Jacksonbacteria bacterium RIFCSPLOWO2_02_FULL_43_9]HAZ16530.1 hypothetical protein [Candidatus Jacksonbacteria bacter
MSHYLGWKIRGFYDGKILAIKDAFLPQDCIFLDMEIFRQNIRSVGQHMIMYDKTDLPANWNNFDNCIAANNLRSYDFKNNFKLKYPLGTIHILLSILGQNHAIPIPKNAISPLLYTDGTFKNQFNYPENCLNWLDFLGANNANNPLHAVFLDRQYSTYELMVELKDLFSKINVIGGEKRGGDKIKLSDSRGNITNIDSLTYQLKPTAKSQAETFLRMLADKTGWTFTPNNWSWGPYQTTRFKKGSIKPGKARYNALLAQNPISLAIISRNSIEYTIDENDVL